MTLIQKLQSILASKLDIKSAITTKTGTSPGDVLEDYADDIEAIQPQGLCYDAVPISNSKKVIVNPPTLTSSVKYFSTDGGYYDTKFNFYEWTKLEEVSLFDTSSGINFKCMFQYCEKLKRVPLFDTSNGTTFQQMFLCRSFPSGVLQSVPLFDTSNGTRFSRMFQYQKQLIEVPQFNLSSATNVQYMFDNCQKLETVPQLNLANVEWAGFMFGNCYNLTNLGGFTNLKVSLGLNNSSNLTHDSLLNVLNGLYDLTGSSSKTLNLGSTNLNKLTAEEKAIATNKNWILA